MSRLNSPIPYWGSKRAAAPLVNQALGAGLTRYIEPCGGGLSVLLSAERPGTMEVANDLDGQVVNFFRALKYAPDEVAYYADFPASQTEYAACFHWLQQQPEIADQLAVDLDYYDAKLAGRWAWYISSNISLNRIDYTRTPTKPRLSSLPGGMGVSAQQKRIRIPDTSGRMGVNRYKSEYPDGLPVSGERLLDSFYDLAKRLEQVYIYCGDWSKLTSPTCLGLAPTNLTRGHVSGVFLDPPYATVGRKGLYNQDSWTLAQDIRAWAVEASERWGKYIRLVVAGYEGDYNDEPWPDGWTNHAWSTDGTRMGGQSTAQHKRIETLWCSPFCFPDLNSTQQPTLW